MLHQILPVIITDLNSFLRRRLNIEESPAMLSELVTQEGLPLPAAHNKVVAMVTGIEQEHSVRNQSVARDGVPRHPPLQLNIKLLFAANFPGNYVEALRFISLVLSFFQGKQIFTAQNTPELPEAVEKITAEIANMDLSAQQQLWNAIGAKMIPSVSLKLRMITITRNQILDEVPEITGTSTSPSPNS